MTTQFDDYPLPEELPDEAENFPDESQKIEPVDLPIGKELYENLSGTAGTGKTWTAKQLVAQSPPGSVVLAATTGIAAVNLGEGTTINSLLKYFDTNSLRDNYVAGQIHAQIRKLRRSGVERILLDEKSMLSGQQLTIIARAIREVNEGGIFALDAVGAGEGDEETSYGRPHRDDVPPIGLTLIGDFGQLPPVPEEDHKTGRKLPVEFAFDSPEWPIFAEHSSRLEKIWRQDATDFIEALQAVRRSDHRKALDFFQSNRFCDTTDDHFNGTTIYATNAEVERYNQLRLDALKTPEMSFTTIRRGVERGEWKKQIPDVLRLKEEALVMILANRRVYADEEDEYGRIIYANGSLGTIVGKSAGELSPWMVRLQHNGEVVRVFPIERQNTVPLEVGEKKQIREAFEAGTGPDPATIITEEGKGRNKVIGSILYMPLRAAYGCTVHKTQGLTLDNVQINIRDPFFRQPGMLFVALSRARTAGGLRIVGNQRGFLDRCKSEPRVQAWL